jgi:hypothetical protein
MQAIDKETYKHRIVELEGGFYVKLSRINQDITLLRFIYSSDSLAEIAIPPNFSMIKKSSGEVIESYKDTYIVCWASNYELKHGDKTVLIIE